ncbi:hypothetical protein THRCLA_20877 [Thraustotheca clavata]|uniref:Uncharacterized protein n=1 Tax=Thraustotheca clavata TaxID=74557 RepID=A0A1W0A2G3_9STRA|nr:hypothetical protein THRCLA_20877 [Thraustotheca clavata]
MQTRAQTRQLNAKELSLLGPETPVHIQINILTTPSSPTYHYFTRSRAHSKSIVEFALPPPQNPPSTTKSKSQRRQKRRSKAKKKNALPSVQESTANEPTTAAFFSRKRPTSPPPPSKRRCIDVDDLLDDLCGLTLSKDQETSLVVANTSLYNPFEPVLQLIDNDIAQILESIQACHISRPASNWDDLLIQMSSIRLVEPSHQHVALEQTLAQFTGLSLTDSRRIVTTQDYQYLQEKLTQMTV